MAILNEIVRKAGEAAVRGAIAYAPQSSWVVSNTVRSNIVFGKDYVEEGYKRVVDACALSHDLTILPQGDKTIVGERGITLSGGQKARVNLARAVYAGVGFEQSDREP